MTLYSHSINRRGGNQGHSGAHRHGLFVMERWGIANIVSANYFDISFTRYAAVMVLWLHVLVSKGYRIT